MPTETLAALPSKLRYKPGMRIYVRDAPASFAAVLAALPATIVVATGLRGKFDLVQAFFVRKEALERAAPALREALAPGGIAWFCYPKDRALGTDLNRDIARVSLEKFGLTTVSQVAIDAVWSGLRCKV
jgi:hypothetical protein